jgi:hypothetical protein
LFSMVSPQTPYGFTTGTHGFYYETVKCFLGPFRDRHRDASIALARPFNDRYGNVCRAFAEHLQRSGLGFSMRYGDVTVTVTPFNDRSTTVPRTQVQDERT